MATLREVAQAAGVSISTVSRVVNGYEHVSEDIRSKVSRAVKELNYEPNLLAKALVQGRDTKQLGLLVHDVSNTYFAEIAGAFENVASQHGYLVMLCSSSRVGTIGTYLETFIQRRVDGVAIVAGGLSPQDILRLEQLVKRDIPVVITRERGWLTNKDWDYLRDNIGIVELDYYTGAKMATEYLISLGHERIGLLCSHPKSFLTQDPRILGFREVLAEKGLPFEESQVAYNIGFKEASGASGMRELLSREQKLSAVIAYNDLVAIGALAACREEGISVPDDLSIIGFDNIEASQFTYPQLTTVDVPKQEQGELIVEHLLSQIKERHHPVKHRYTAELIVRKSTSVKKKREILLHR